MKKDFSQWHSIKTIIENEHHPPLFREQEIWWCSLGTNIGFEEDGKSTLFERPVLVWRKFNRELFWGLPMTSKKKEGRFYYSFPLHDHDRTVIISQLRVLSAKRLIRRLSKLSDHHFVLLDQSVCSFIKETDPLRGPRVPIGNLC